MMNLLPSFKVLLRAFLLVLLAGSACTEQLGTSSNIALTGVVSSQKEGLMEGVVVILRREDEQVLTAVSSNATGRFTFNRDRLSAGQYEITVREAGYKLAETQLIASGLKPQQASLELSLHTVTDPLRLASQLTSLD